MKTYNIMVLAAGEGTRLRPYTNLLPKPLIPFLGVPLIHYGIELFLTSEKRNLKNLVYNSYHLKEKLSQYMKAQKFENEELIESSENPLLGSGGGIHKAIESLITTKNFVVMNGDEVILPNQPNLMDAFLDQHEKSGALATLMVMSHPEVGSKFGGAWVSRDNRVDFFAKQKPENYLGQGFHYLGVLALNSRIKRYFKPGVTEENILYETLTVASHQGELVEIFRADCDWFETGNPKDFLNATETVANRMLATETSRPEWYDFVKRIRAKHKTDNLVIENDSPNIANLVKRV